MIKPCLFDQKKSYGMTLMELLIILLLALILALVAIAQFSALQTRVERNSLISLLNGVLSESRSLALTQRKPVAICGSHDGNLCSDDGWSSGLLIFVDQHIADRLHQTGEDIVYYHALNLKYGDLTWRGAAAKNVLFQADSGLARGSNGSFYYCAKDGAHSQRLVLSYMGHTRVEPISSC
jgi:type IV fimbrial biogenesis protein FimT